jgi:uncharacterized protein (DUF433 family)
MLSRQPNPSGLPPARSEGAAAGNAGSGALPRISRDPRIMGGTYCIRGQRIPVGAIKRMAREWSHDTILSEYPTLTQADIDAALAFRRKA